MRFPKGFVKNFCTFVIVRGSEFRSTLFEFFSELTLQKYKNLKGEKQGDLFPGLIPLRLHFVKVQSIKKLGQKLVGLPFRKDFHPADFVFGR